MSGTVVEELEHTRGGGFDQISAYLTIDEGVLQTDGESVALY